MKKFLIGMFASVLFLGSAKAQSLEDSSVLITRANISVNGMFARTIELKNFDSRLKVEKTIALNLNDFNDDGTKNDLVAGDGIYTSVKLFKTKFEEGYIFKSDSFRYEKQFNNFLSTSKIKFSIKCKIRRVHTGTTSIFGTDCSTHWCIELYDCEVDFGWD